MVTRIKAHNGNRAVNLEKIAEAIDRLLSENLPNADDGSVRLDAKEAHSLKGYAEQLRIIADEISPTVS